MTSKNNEDYLRNFEDVMHILSNSGFEATETSLSGSDVVYLLVQNEFGRPIYTFGENSTFSWRWPAKWSHFLSQATIKFRNSALR